MFFAARTSCLALVASALTLSPAPALTQGTLIADLDTSGADEGLDGQVAVRGTALGSLWLNGRRLGIESPVWRLPVPGAPAEPFPLPWDGASLGADAELFAVGEVAGRALLAVREAQTTRLFSTDGTPGGTIALPAAVSLSTQLASTDAENPIRTVGGRAYFVGTTPATGEALFETDGTPAGTRVLYERNAGVPGDSINGFRLLGTRAIVQSGFDNEILESVDLATGAALALLDSAPAQVPFDGLRLGARLVFAWNDDPAESFEPWVTDGTPAGTQLLADVAPGAAASFPNLLAGDGSRAFFSAQTPTTGRELWTTDGTASGTGLVVDLAPGTASGAGNEGALSVGRLIFSGSTDGAEREPWSSDGSVSGTVQLGDVQPGPGGSDPREFRSVLGGVAFSADTTDGREPVFTAGLVTVVTALGDLAPGSADSDPAEFTGYGGQIVFSARFPFGRELWSAPVSGNASLLADIGELPGSASSSPRSFTSSAGRGFFQADTPDGEALFVTAGGVGDASLVAIADDLDFEPLGALGTGLVFRRRFTGQSIEPWFTDGTLAGTVPLGDLVTSGPSQPIGIGQLGSRFFFTADSDGNGREIWSTDGTPAGTSLAVDLNPGPGGGALEPSVPVMLDEEFALLIPALPLTGPGVLAERVLWISDGSPAGTRLLAPALLDGLDVRDVVAHGDGIAIGAIDPAAPFVLRLFLSDGSDAGTTELVSLPGTPIDSLASAGDRLLVLTPGRLIGVDAAGSTSVLLQPSAVPAATSFASFETRSSDAAVLVRVAFGEDVVGLWTSDGTQAGTRRISDQNGPVALAGDGGEFLFRRQELGTGTELWLGDLAGNSSLLLDVLPGVGSAKPRPLGRVGGQLLFSAFTTAAGRELHALPLVQTGGFAAEPFGQGCGLGQRPDLELEGAARLGAATRLLVDDAGALAPTVFYASGQVSELPLGGCSVYLGPRIAIGAAVAGLEGAAALDLAIPSQPFWLGANLWLQAAVVQFGGPALGSLGLTNGLELVLGE